MNGIAKRLGVLIALIILPFLAIGRENVPIVDYDDVLVATGSGKMPTADQVRDVIIGAARINRWTVGKPSDQNLLSATLVVNNKHTVIVSIPYSAEKFSIKYQDSVNMKYGVSSTAVEGSTDLTKLNTPAKSFPAGTPMIHPAYNKWVHALLQSIQLELRKL